jgi:hypothetical protein
MCFFEDGILQPKNVALHKFSKNPRSTSEFLLPEGSTVKNLATWHQGFVRP